MSTQPDASTLDHEKHHHLNFEGTHDERHNRSLSPNPFGDDKGSESSYPGLHTPKRHSSESSTTRSKYGGVDPIAEKPGISTKELGVYHTKSHLNLRIHDDASNTILYYVDNSVWTRKKPDVTLHAGSEKTGPILGVAKYTMFSSDMKVGLGDPNISDMGGSAMAWEDVTKESKIKHSSYKWSMTLPGTYDRRSFIWKRTHHFGLENEGRTAKWAVTNFKLVDDQTGEIVANFANNGIKQWKKMGKLVVTAQYGQEWELMVLLTVFAIIEKARRRERARRSGKGGGGGGGGGGC